MLIRGQQKLLALFWAVLGTCLASIGCLEPTGAVSPAINGSAAFQGQPLGCVSCTTAAGSLPAGAPGAAGVVQTAYQPGSEPGGKVVTASYAQITPAGQLPPGGDHLMPEPGHDDGHGAVSPGPLPVELRPTSHPPYTVAPADILYIDSLRLIPRPPYLIEPLEALLIQVTNTLPNQPINGIFTVSPDGTVNLGFGYGVLRIAGMTVDQAQAEVTRVLGGTLRDARVSVALVQYRGMQQTRGQHLVRQDGTIGLGTYGAVYVAGLTLGQIKCVLENYLSKWFLNPQISVDVAAYNSKVYYVIADGGGFGQSVIRLPITGNETVLDAIANVQGLPPIASKRRIWVARPAPAGHCYQVLPVDWRAITEGGATDTNYQLFPGDRVFVSANRLIAFDNYLSMVFAPIERVLGLTLLGNFTAQSFRNNGSSNGNNGFGFVAVGR